jgi:hypothetical protein
MSGTALKRQFIRDAEGRPIGVILPLEEFTLVEQFLEQHAPVTETTYPIDRSSPPTHSVKESEYFGMWADREDMHGLSSREWLQKLRAKQWKA